MQRSYAALCAAIEREVPRFRIVRKDRASSQRLIHRVLWVLSLGRMRDYLSRYVTTLGSVVYVPPDFDTWDEGARVVVLHHERVHLRQFQRLGWVPMTLLYLLGGLPVGLAWGRARLEREAYAATIGATLALEGEAAARALRPEVIRRFCSADYLWMWPFPKAVGRWFDATLDAACQSVDPGASGNDASASQGAGSPRR